MQDKGLTAEQASKRTGVNVGRLGGSTPSTTTTKGPVGSTGSASSNAFSGTPAQQMFSTNAGKKDKGLTIRGVRVGQALSGKEAMKLAATGLGERAIDKALAKGASIQGSAQRRLDKGQLATSEQGLLNMVFDNTLPDRNGGRTGGGIPSSLDPRSKDVQALRGLDLQPGQRFLGATGSGEPILATKDMLGGGRRRGGGGGAGEPEVTDDPAVAEEPAGSGPILPEEEEEDTTADGGLMTGSVEAGRSALGIKRRRSRAQRLRLAQLGTSRLNRLKIRSMLNLRGASGLV